MACVRSYGRRVGLRGLSECLCVRAWRLLWIVHIKTSRRPWILAGRRQRHRRQVPDAGGRVGPDGGFTVGEVRRFPRGRVAHQPIRCGRFGTLHGGAPPVFFLRRISYINTPHPTVKSYVIQYSVKNEPVGKVRRIPLLSTDRSSIDTCDVMWTSRHSTEALLSMDIIPCVTPGASF